LLTAEREIPLGTASKAELARLLIREVARQLEEETEN